MLIRPRGDRVNGTTLAGQVVSLVFQLCQELCLAHGSHHGPNSNAATESLPDLRQELLCELQAAAALFNKDEARLAAGSGRTGVISSLAAVLKYLHDNVDVDHMLLNPLFRLLMGLNDADAGQAVPMLKPSDIGGKKPPVSVNERVQRAYIAAAVELVRRNSTSNELAARWVARQAMNLPVFERLRTEPWRAVLKWREQASSVGAAQNEETKFYRMVLRDLDEKNDGFLATTQDCEAAARELIELAQKYGNPKSPRSI